MPIQLPPLTRRTFLGAAASVGAAAAGVAFASRSALAAPKLDPHRFALFSDTHIAGDKALVKNNVHLSKNLETVVADVLKCDPLPANLLVNGDLALLTGQSADYATFLELITPIRQAGIAIHLLLGNHDDRANFWKAAPAAEKKPIEERHVAILETPRANFFLLDTLDQVNKTPGVVGENQLAWLSRELDSRANRPAIVFTHHHPENLVKVAGITDVEALNKVLDERRQVKAHFFGHTHVWLTAERQGIQRVNLPPVAYVFTPGKPNGWVDLQLREDGMTVELRSVDPKHADHGQKKDLAWRK